LEIKGVKICLSQEISSQKHSDKKQDVFDELKKEALKNFDLLVKSKKNDDSNGEGGYFTNLINNIGQNITIKLKDIELVYIFHISNREIVKFGLKLGCLELKPCPKELFSNRGAKEINLRKLLKLEGLALYFDVYDETFVKRYQENNAAIMNEELSNLHNYILNDLNVEIDLEMKLGKTTDIKTNVSISPILLHFNQKQIKFLLIFFQKFSEIQSTRPKYRPTDKRSVVLWWRYALRKVMEKENIKSRVYHTSFSTLVNEEKYKILYTKKFLNDNTITPLDAKFMEKFENETDLPNILKIRNIALDQIKLMSFKWKKGDRAERKYAEEWFKQYDGTFSSQRAMEINLENRKPEEKQMNLRLGLNLESFSLIIRENDIIDSLKNLQNHVYFFKSALGDQEQLKNKVIEHIKINFIKGLHEANLTTTNPENINKTLAAAIDGNDRTYKMQAGNFDSKLKVQDYLDLITSKNDNSENSHRFLLCLTIENIAIDLRMEKSNRKVSMTVKKILGIDLLGVNRQIKHFLDISQEIKLYYSSTFIKLMNLRGINYADDLQSIQQVHLDLEIPKIDAFIHKPFIERISSVTEYLTFDIGHSKQKTTFNEERNSLFFDSILKRKEQITQQINMSVTIGKINCYFPTDYDSASYMFVLHLNQLKLYKREHANDGNEKKVVAITDTNAENDFFNQNFEPLIITIQNLRGLIVKDPQWEIIENPFYYDIHFREKMNTTYITSIFEILNIYVSMEKYTQTFTLANKVEVFPSEQKISIKLPLIILNLSVKNISILMNLLQLWTNKTSQIKLSQIKNSLNLHKDNDKNVSHHPHHDTRYHPGVSMNARFKDRNLAKTKLIDHNLTYEEKIGKILDKIILSQIDLKTEGIVINFNVDDEKSWTQKNGVYHQNSIMSIYLHTVSFLMTSKYFESQFLISLKQFLIEHYNKCDQMDVKQHIKTTYQELVEEELRKQKILDDEDEKPDKSGADLHRIRARTSFIKQSIRREPQCQRCFNGNSNHLIMNFINPTAHPDLEVQISIISDEYDRIKNENSVATSIQVDLAPLTMVADPEAFKQIKMLFDYAGLYASMKYDRFVKFMKSEAFWPEVNIDDYLIGANDVEEIIKQEDKGIAVTQIDLNLPTLNIIFLHKKEPIYLLSLENISMFFKSYLRDSELNLKTKKITFYNTSTIAGPHKQIISTIEGTDEALTLQMKMFGRYKSIVNNYSIWLGVKLNKVKIVFLKKLVQEVVEYLRFQLLKSFDNQIEGVSGEEAPPSDERSDMKLELVVLESIIEGFRNSLSDSALYFDLKKLGLWSCGKWGNESGTLIETGKFEWELEKQEETTNSEKFEDAESGEIDDETSNLYDNLRFADKSPTRPDKRTQQPGAFPEDTYKLTIEGLTVKDREKGGDESIFIKFADNSYDLEIIFEDKTFPIKEKNQKEYPMKCN